MASHNKWMYEGVPEASSHSLASDVAMVLIYGLGIFLVMMIFFAGVVV